MRYIARAHPSSFNAEVVKRNQYGTTLLSLGNKKIFDVCKKPLDCYFLVSVHKEPGF